MKATMSHASAIVSHLRAAAGHARAIVSHARAAVSHLKATMSHARVAVIHASSSVTVNVQITVLLLLPRGLQGCVMLVTCMGAGCLVIVTCMGALHLGSAGPFSR